MENQGIDFRLLTTKEEKPRFFLLCYQSEPGRYNRPGFFTPEKPGKQARLKNVRRGG
jgi:hypothetical protein